VAQGDLDHGGGERVAQQPVGPMMGDPVQGAALGHAKVAHAETAAVLQLNEGAAAQYPQAAVDSAHWLASRGLSSPPRRMNSARSMGTKRTRSPGCSRL